MLSAGIFALFAFSMARRSLGLDFGSPPPMRAAIVISLMIWVNILPRLPSVIAFLRFIVAHFECPDISLMILFMLLEIFNFQLGKYLVPSRMRVGTRGEPFMLVDREHKIEPPAVVPDLADHRAESESDPIEDAAVLPDLEPEVIFSNDPRSPHDFHVSCEEDRTHVSRAVGGELFEDPEESWGGVLELVPAVDLQFGGFAFVRHELIDGNIEGFAKLIDFVQLDREPGGVLVAPKLDQLVLDALQRLVNIEPDDAPRGTTSHAVDRGHHDRGPVILLDKPGSDDPDDPGMPLLLMKDDGGICIDVEQVFDELLRLHKRIFIDSPPISIFFLEYLREDCRRFRIFLGEEFHSPRRISHPSDRVDSRREHEDDLPGCDFSHLGAGAVDERPESGPRIRVDPFEADSCEDPVFADQRDNVGRRCHRREIHVLIDIFLLIAAAGDCLHQFETDSAPAEVFKRVRASGLERIEHGSGFGDFYRRFVVVADDDVDPFGPGVFYLRSGGDPTIDRYEKCRAELFPPVDSDRGDSVALRDPVRDVKHRLQADSLEKEEEHGGAVGSVHVVIAEDEHALMPFNRARHPGNGFFHAVHEERVMKIS